MVVVDKTCEIGGDGVVPHPAIGNARWLPVESYKKEGQVPAQLASPPLIFAAWLRREPSEGSDGPSGSEGRVMLYCEIEP